jgi:hypothetical protein
VYVLVVAMPALPAIHPRMASEQDGPTPTRQLEPPGVMALNYGRRTPISVILAQSLLSTEMTVGKNRPSALPGDHITYREKGAVARVLPSQ